MEFLTEKRGELLDYQQQIHNLLRQIKNSNMDAYKHNHAMETIRDILRWIEKQKFDDLFMKYEIQINYLQTRGKQTSARLQQYESKIEILLQYIEIQINQIKQLIE